MNKLTRQTITLVVFAVGAALALSCGDDSTGPVGGTPTSVKKDLSNKSDVLNNIEYAYNKKNMPTYNELLDDNFTFFYTDNSVGGGTPVQWGRPDEVTTTSGLLAAATSIDLTLDWRDSQGSSVVQWSEQISGSETWYYATVFYHYTIKIGNYTYIPNAGAKAQFTVRNAGTTENPKWKLVEFRDLGGPSLVRAISAVTEPTMWGQLKALYR
jgi:hypothetical protein